MRVCDIMYYSEVKTLAVVFSLRFWLAHEIFYLYVRKTESPTLYWSLNIVIIIAILDTALTIREILFIYKLYHMITPTEIVRRYFLCRQNWRKTRLKCSLCISHSKRPIDRGCTTTTTTTTIYAAAIIFKTIILSLRTDGPAKYYTIYYTTPLCSRYLQW